MNDHQSHDQIGGDQLVKDAEFQFAICELDKLLDRVSDIMHTWRHEIAEQININDAQTIAHANLQVRHWLQHHNDQNALHTPQQFFEALRRMHEEHNRANDE